MYSRHLIMPLALTVIVLSYASASAEFCSDLKAVIDAVAGDMTSLEGRFEDTVTEEGATTKIYTAKVQVFGNCSVQDTDGMKAYLCRVQESSHQPLASNIRGCRLRWLNDDNRFEFRASTRRVHREFAMATAISSNNQRVRVSISFTRFSSGREMTTLQVSLPQ